MSFLKYIKRNTWLLMLLVSFVMYEALWSLIEFQLGELYFDTKDILCDFAQCVLFTSAVFFVNYGFRKYRGGRYAESTAEIICIFIVCSLLIFIIDRFFYDQYEADDNFWNMIDVYIICIICSLLSIINIQRSHHERFVAMRQEHDRLRLNLLQQQLSPHFLFNSLSTLQGIILSDSQKAERYVVSLSNILRYITENIGKEKVALSDEVNFIEDYVQILDMRFPQHFIFKKGLDGIPNNASIIPVSIQIAVENAIKHNKHSCKCPLEISITLGGDFVEVSNRKHPIVTVCGSGLGIKNLEERYKLLIGKGLDICETADNYTIKIPLIYEGIDSRG